MRFNVLRSAFNALLQGIFLGLVLLSPIIVGIPLRFETHTSAFVVGALLGFLLCGLWILSRSGRERAQGVVLAVVSCFLSVTILDVASRPFVASFVTPPDGVWPWPKMPLVGRLDSDVHHRGTIHGTWAFGRLRQDREFTIITDHFGFRNEGMANKPLDAIVLGDSVAMGDVTTQDKIWPVILSKQYGLAVYNISISGDGPWHEYTNLTTEIDRLKLKDSGSVVIWTLFTGNDLTDPCYPIFDKRDLPWRTGVAALKSSLRRFRDHSPLGQLLDRFLHRAETEEGPSSLFPVGRFPNGTETVFFRPFDEEVHRDLEGVRHHRNYDCVRQTIIAMKKFAQSRNLAVGIMVAPAKEEVYSWVLAGGRPWSTPPAASGFALAVGEICREEHIPFLDLKPALVAASERVYRESGGQLYWRDDAHWNNEGNMEVATIAYQFYTLVRSSKPVH